LLHSAFKFLFAVLLISHIVIPFVPDQPHLCRSLISKFSEFLIPLVLAQAVVLGTTTVKLGKAIGAATKPASQTQACLALTTAFPPVAEAALAAGAAVVAWGAPKRLSFSNSPPNSSSIRHRQRGTDAAFSLSWRKPMACVSTGNVISPQHKTKLPKLHRKKRQCTPSACRAL
jgi:hypothetical protein